MRLLIKTDLDNQTRFFVNRNRPVTQSNYNFNLITNRSLNGEQKVVSQVFRPKAKYTDMMMIKNKNQRFSDIICHQTPGKNSK